MTGSVICTVMDDPYRLSCRIVSSAVAGAAQLRSDGISTKEYTLYNVLYTAFTVAIKGGGEKECAAVMAYGIYSLRLQPQSTHRVAMPSYHHDGKISPALLRVRGCTPSPYHHEQKVVMYAPTKRADTLAPLYLIRTQKRRLC